MVPRPLEIRMTDQQTRALAPLLRRVSARVREDPATLELAAGGFRMRAPRPAGYTPRANRASRDLQARVTLDGWLFEISEVSEGLSAGWMASCIPPAVARTFLSAWLAGTAARQMELFACS